MSRFSSSTSSFSDYHTMLNNEVWNRLPDSKVRIGNVINVRCPVCGDSKKSLTKKRGYYYLNDSRYYCFNCNVSMSAMKLLRFLGCDENFFDEIKIKGLQNQLSEAGMINLDDGKKSNSSLSVSTSSSSILDPQLKKPVEFLKHKQDLTDNAIYYLNNRFVLNAPFLKTTLYSCSSAKTNHEYILIPWEYNKIGSYYQVNNFMKYKNENKYLFPSKLKKTVFGIDHIDCSFPYIICFEGVYDSIFVKNGVAIGGKSLTKFQEKMIQTKYPKHEIVFAFDNDNAGLDAISKITSDDPNKKIFMWMKHEKYKGEKDINELIISTKNPELFVSPEQIESNIVSSTMYRLEMQFNY